MMIRRSKSVKEMRRVISVLFVWLAVAVSLSAQERKPRFSPEKFQAKLEQFIEKEAGLTQQEAARFFPEYREMMRKQRCVFDRIRKLGRNKPADEAGCMNVIKQRDKLELELKKIQQTYNNKFLTIIPAGKLFDVIKAEDRFHRCMLKKSNGNNQRHKEKR